MLPCRNAFDLRFCIAVKNIFSLFLIVIFNVSDNVVQYFSEHTITIYDIRLFLIPNSVIFRPLIKSLTFRAAFIGCQRNIIPVPIVFRHKTSSLSVIIYIEKAAVKTTAVFVKQSLLILLYQTITTIYRRQYIPHMYTGYFTGCRSS